MKLDEDLLHYYTEELSYLRSVGREYARKYPKIADRLELQDGYPADPHVERLIESFALLTARIQHEMDAEFPEITSALLGVLYPQMSYPVPPMEIARFEIDAKRGKFTTGHLIQKNTPLFAYGSRGATCRFRTAYPVTVCLDCRRTYPMSEWAKQGGAAGATGTFGQTDLTGTL